MAVTLYTLLESILLFVNALAILNQERFLKKIGWTNEQFSSSGSSGLKAKLVTLIFSIQTVMRVPLIGINSVVIVAKLLFG